MNWKEFFKPTWEKIVLTVVIFIISFIFLRLDVYFCALGSPYSFVCPLWGLSQFVFFWPALVANQATMLGNALILLSIPWIYFVSSLIVFVYKKFKKRR